MRSELSVQLQYLKLAKYLIKIGTPCISSCNLCLLKLKRKCEFGVTLVCRKYRSISSSCIRSNNVSTHRINASLILHPNIPACKLGKYPVCMPHVLWYRILTKTDQTWAFRLYEYIIRRLRTHTIRPILRDSWGLFFISLSLQYLLVPINTYIPHIWCNKALELY